jgi:acetyl-CoA acetyltransferase
MSTSDKSRLVSLLTASKVPHEIPADAIVIIGGVRTPITKAARGGLKDYKADQLLAVVLKVHKRFRCISPSTLSWVVLG